MNDEINLIIILFGFLLFNFFGIIMLIKTVNILREWKNLFHFKFFKKNKHNQEFE